MARVCLRFLKARPTSACCAGVGPRGLCGWFAVGICWPAGCGTAGHWDIMSGWGNGVVIVEKSKCQSV